MVLAQGLMRLQSSEAMIGVVDPFLSLLTWKRTWFLTNASFLQSKYPKDRGREGKHTNNQDNYLSDFITQSWK